MIRRRALFWMVWIFGTISQGFGFLFAQVPRRDSLFLGAVLMVACCLLIGAVVLGRTRWRSTPVETRQDMQANQLTPIESIATITAVVQLAACVYWLLDLLIHELHR